MGRDFICPKVIGGLGNQLFVLMTAYAFAKEEKTELVIDPRNYAACPGRRVNIYWDTFLVNLKPFVQYGHRPKKDNVIKEAQCFVYKKLVRNQKGRTQLRGYFQSYKYFHKYRTDILAFFELDYTIYNYLHNKYEWLDLHHQALPLKADLDIAIQPISVPTEKPIAIAIHVRRGDYVLKGHYVLPLTYYQNCLEQVKDQLISDMKTGRRVIVAIFSDDTNWCQSFLLPMIQSYFTNILPSADSVLQSIIVRGEKDHVELYMLQYCDIYFLANSTFSWWGAYLNRKKEVKVFMPYRWMTANHPCPPELVCPGWKIVNY